MMITIITIIITILGFLSSFYLFYQKPLIIKKTNKKNIDISIIIPARNEELSIANLLNDLQNQSNVNFEVIVVDDGSTDQTKQIVSSFSVKYVYVSTEEKPKDYLGKSFAVEYGTKFSKFNTLLFLDADVRLEKDALISLINIYNEDKVISVQPYHKTQKYYEQFSLPFNLIALSANNTTTPSNKSIGLFGPCILISKENYLKIGRHYHVRQSIIEDVELGKLLTKHNVDFECFLGFPMINYRMYPNGFKSLFEGWTKNIIYGASNTTFLLSILSFLFIASILAIPLEITKSIFSKNYILLIFYIIFYLLWIIRLSVITKQIGLFKKSSILFFPVIFINFLIVFVLSLIKRVFKIPVKWKDRKIKVDK